MKKSNLSKIVLAGILTSGIVMASHTQVKADQTQDLKNQVQMLQQKVDQLEKQLAIQAAQPVAVNPSAAPGVIVRTYDAWDPFAEMRLMERQMNQMLRDNAVDFNPKEDIKQTPDHYIISMDIPGMEKDKINVEVKSGMLVVSGDRNSEIKEEKPHQFYRQERSFGHFYRTMPLPGDAKADNIEAQYNNGVLTVKVSREKTGPKSATGQKITIK